MATGMPELGSKISLISKADIRYEGRLFTVDPQECTIALASVRSFGTEDRDTQYPVPAQNQIYDYILFRGSDIKDIRVINNASSHPQPLNDPAIMQLSMPPHAMQAPAYPGHHVMRGPPVPMEPPFAHPYAGIGASLGLPCQDAGLASKPNLIGGSRSASPTSLRSRKSPTNDQGVQTGQHRQGGRKPVRPIQPPAGQWNQQHQQRRKSADRKDNNHQNHQQHNRPNYHSNNQQQQQQYNSPRGNWSNRGQMRNWSRPQGGAQGYRSKAPVGGGGGGGGGGGQRPRNMLKFDNDYDFEQANTEFEELMSQLGKVKIEEAGEAGAAPAAGAASSKVGDDPDKKDDSGNETGAGENEQDEDQQHQEVFYDKTKSFFDKISCEAVEKAKGKSQRTDWRVERKLNSETFGVAATRRGAFRGRGGFRGSYRGGYRNNYYRQPQRNQQQKPPQQQQQNNQQPQQQQQQVQQQPSSASQQQQDLRDRSLGAQAQDEEGAGEFVPEPAMAVK